MTKQGYMPVAQRDDWRTPQSFFDDLHREFDFTIDAAASAENKMLDRYWSIEQNAIMQDWRGERVWCNPPYGRAQNDFIRKAAALDADISVLLIPARTDTKIWHDCIFGIAEVRFVKGRLKFEGGAYSAPFPSAVCIWKRS